MRPSHASKKGRRYRYYVSADLVEGSVATGRARLAHPGGEIEAAVARAVAARLRDPEFQAQLLGSGTAGAAALGQRSSPASSSWPTCSRRRLRRPVAMRCGG